MSVMEDNGMQTSRETGNADGLKAVRMYPNNSLKEPVRKFENSVFQLLKNSFSN
jgi:hypothetical protein